MSDEQARERERDIEERVRELLAEDAYTIRPSPAPYPAIRRRGVVERRRRVAAAGAALVTLAALPVGAYAVGGGGGGGSSTGTPQSSVGATLSPTRAATPTPSATPSGPAGPATAGQLLDQITFAQAADGLDKCLAYNKGAVRHAGSVDLGTAEDYRIILAMNSTGDSNAPGDGMYVVAVQERPQRIRLICTLRNGTAEGLNTSVGDDGAPGAVSADINGGKLYQQSFLDKGHWKLPFRWG